MFAVDRTEREFCIVRYPGYPNESHRRLIQESSAIGDYEDAFDKPGSSSLWIGESHHLNREEVSDLIENLQGWLDNGTLWPPEITGEEEQP